jgi:hypothetical protein
MTENHGVPGSIPGLAILGRADATFSVVIDDASL